MIVRVVENVGSADVEVAVREEVRDLAARFPVPDTA
jgi:hypothetical protein